MRLKNKNKSEPDAKTHIPGKKKSNPHPKTKPGKRKSPRISQVGAELALCALVQSALHQGALQSIRLSTAAPRSHKADAGRSSLTACMPAALKQCMYVCRKR